MSEKMLTTTCSVNILIPTKALKFILKKSNKVRRDPRKNVGIIREVSSICCDSINEEDTRLLFLSKKSGKIFTYWTNKHYEKFCIFKVVLNLENINPIDCYSVDIVGYK